MASFNFNQRPLANIEKIKEFEFFRDSRNAYRAQILNIEGHLYIRFTLFYFDLVKAEWIPTRKNFTFPIQVWNSFLEVTQQLDEATKNVFVDGKFNYIFVKYLMKE